MCSVGHQLTASTHIYDNRAAEKQGLEFVRGLEPLKLVGMDIVEVSPAYDHAEITAIAAASVAYDWLAVLAKQRGATPKPVGRI